jgi:hypothetical protein
VLLFSLLAGCKKDDNPIESSDNEISKYDATLATDWYKLMLTLVQRTPGFTPPVGSRAFGYVGVTLYQSLLPGMGNYQSLVGQLNGLTSLPQPTAGASYNWPLVANAAVAAQLRNLFPTTSDSLKTQINLLEARFKDTFKSGLSQATIDSSIAYGARLAAAIFEWSKTDGGHEGYLKNFPTNYTPPQGPGMWVPTPPAFQRALQPYWGKNRPFILPVGNPSSVGDPGPHPQYSVDPTSQFYKEGLEVYNTVKNLTAEQREIALFWADDAGTTVTPPGHSISILTQLITLQGKKLDFAAEAYAKIGIGAADGFIACWDVKYKYNLLRPISYIQKVIDSTWNKASITDPLTTPPFPEYTSGHSSQGGASFTILKNLFGNIGFTDHTHDYRGLAPRTFANFDAALNENAISRLYGGIHYRAAIERGVESGKQIGALVNALKFKK